MSRIPNRTTNDFRQVRKAERALSILDSEVEADFFFRRSHSPDSYELETNVQRKLDEMEFENTLGNAANDDVAILNRRVDYLEFETDLGREEAASSGSTSNPTEVVMFNNSSYSDTIGAGQALDGTKVLGLNPVAQVGNGSTSITAVSGGEITLQPGIYTISANFFFSSSGAAHNSIAIRFGVGGVGTGPTGASGYISMTSGHNESSVHLVEYAIEVPNTTSKTVELWIGNLASVTGGTVTSAVGDSIITVKRHADIS